MVVEINVSPFANNVLDLVGDEKLVTKDGKRVTVSRSGAAFVVRIDNENKPAFMHDDNLAVSHFLNSLPVCRKDTE